MYVFVFSQPSSHWKPHTRSLRAHSLKAEAWRDAGAADNRQPRPGAETWPFVCFINDSRIMNRFFVFATCSKPGWYFSGITEFTVTRVVAT